MTEQANTSPMPVERSKAAVALDNLVRRHLRVSDPSDPAAISKALRERYADEQQALDQEAAGLPFFKVTRIDTRLPAETSASVEVRQAREDVSRDLDALVGNALLKDIHPELRGWAQHIRQSVEDGVNAARFALDPWQRDQAMATRRLLGDYSRVARFVGAITPGMSNSYRSLAKSLDEVAASILVTIGEVIAQAGFGGGRFLLQAPASELQARRDSVVNALRSLNGSRYANLAQDEWAYGQHALRQVMQYLDASGLTDLRALFQENHVARVLDELVHWATRGSAEDLRALGATAHLTLGRFRRLIMVSKRIPAPPAPPFSAYLDAIHSFLDAFSSGAGYRLLYIARPAIAHYGLYGIGGPDDATQRMLTLTALRGELAQGLDCYLGCDCGSDLVRCQIMLDKVLYDVDRGIDLYVMGTDPEGQGAAEQRAAAFGVVIDQLLGNNPDFGDVHLQGQIRAACSGVGAPPDCAQPLCVPAGSELADVLTSLRNCLWWQCSPGDPPALGDFQSAPLQLMLEELCVQRDAEAQWENLLHTMAPLCFSWGSKLADCEVTPAQAAKPAVANPSGLLVPTQDLVEAAICAVAATLNTDPVEHDCGNLEIGFPETIAHAIGEVSGARRPDATRLDQTFAEPLVEYLEPYCYYYGSEGRRVTWQVGVEMPSEKDDPDSKVRNEIVKRLGEVFGLKSEGVTAILGQRHTTLATGLAEEEAKELVEKANADAKFKAAFFASQLVAPGEGAPEPAYQGPRVREGLRTSRPRRPTPSAPKRPKGS